MIRKMQSKRIAWTWRSRIELASSVNKQGSRMRDIDHAGFIRRRPQQQREFGESIQKPSLLLRAVRPFPSHLVGSQNVFPLNSSLYRFFTSTTDSESPSEDDGSIGSATSKQPAPKTVRLSKFISQHAGVSRKEVERSIRSGDVTLFGKVITSSAALAQVSDLFQPHNAAALVLNGKTVPITPPDDESHPLSPTAPSRVRVWLVHKMAGELVTDLDPFKRPTVMTRVAKLGKDRSSHREHMKAIGRLDMNTEGLLVVTNCGAYARDMEFARNHVHRTYRVRVHGKWQPYKLHALRNGTVVSEGVRYPPMRVTMETTRKRTTATNQWIQITCSQGRNRQIRKALQQLKLTVTRLIRISYGDYELTGIPKGMVKEVPVIPLAEHKHRGVIRRAPRSKDDRSLGSQDAKGSAVNPAPVQWVRMKK